jgi:hypothetical protein
MEIKPFTVDLSVNLEGALTALAILSAAVGYIANVISSFRSRRRDRRERADKLVILEILEEDPLEGLEDRTILERFRDPKYATIAKQWGATAPIKLTENDLTLRLRSLEYDHFVERTIARRFILRTAFTRYSEERTEKEKRKRAHILSRIKPEEVIEKLVAGFDAADDYERHDIVRAYGQLGTSESLDKLIDVMKSADQKLSRKAALEIAAIIGYRG